MTTDDDKSTRKLPEDVDVRWWEPGNEALGDRRKAVQLELIIKAFDGIGITVRAYPPDRPLEEAIYLYREGTILTRDADADRVYDALGLEHHDKTGEAGEAGGKAIAGLHVIEIPADKLGSTAEVLDRLDAMLGVGVATPDHVLHITTSSCCPATEPLPSAGAPVPGINPDPVSDGAGVRVSVVDTGLLAHVVAEHAWLTGVTGQPEPSDIGHYTGHGTFVAGVLRTMAPASEVDVDALMIVGGAVLESELSHDLGEVLERMPDIISMSAGTRTRGGWPLLSLLVFWETRLRHIKGTVLVAAAGNDGDRGPFWPAAFPWAVSVGALDADGSRAGYSNHGSWVDVYARGSDVVNAYPKGVYTYEEPPLQGQQANFIPGLANWSGTSFSTPLVSGLVAARMTWSGESARQAADALLVEALANARPGVGKVLEPGMGDPPVL
ncbi:MAG: S8/S53 family peptidase [Intrasporangium sp.]|uniref:S8 family peptidase n=1 Tax=Intrasporangium sp. TaxID=1925024 RepID=UPI002649D866|nr:S8/S53 family peptidase [Intrasporangium sp.]MDN5795259.1 S8/S53 family peptidase [Intrasporangium sp.]